MIPLITDHPTVINARLAARVGGKIRRDPRKLRVRQARISRGSLELPFGSRELQRYVHAKRFMGLDPDIRGDFANKN